MIDIRITFVQKDRDEESQPTRSHGVGGTLTAFIRDLRLAKRPLRVITLLTQQIVTRELLAVGACHVSYEGPEEDLRPLREALWYYTRHPQLRHLLDAPEHLKLVRLCEKHRWEMRKEAQMFSSNEDIDLDTLWRRSLLFAVKVKDKNDLARALRLDDETFESLIELRADDAERSLPFSELLATVETSAPA